MFAYGVLSFVEARCVIATGVPLARGVKCVHQIEMSLFLPFRNVTVVGVGRRAGAEPQRSAAFDRRPIDRSSHPHPLSIERAPARSARRTAQPTLKTRASR